MPAVSTDAPLTTSAAPVHPLACSRGTPARMIAPSGSRSRPTRTATRRGGGGPAVGTRLRTTPTCDGLSALRPSAMFAGISPPVLPSSSGQAFRVEHPSDREFGPQSRRRGACTGPDRRPEACTPQALHGEPGTLSMTGPVDPTSRPPRTSGTPGPNSGGSCPERCAVRAGTPRRPPDHRARRAGHPPRRRHRPRPGRRDPRRPTGGRRWSSPTAWNRSRGCRWWRGWSLFVPTRRAPDLASAGLPALVPLRSGDDPRVG